ncbi:MAG: serine/threonine protein kinase [Oliverpabstia sp.]
MLQIGSVVDGKYKVLSIIGHGGMSVVYLALNERANKTWAIKEIRKEGVQDFTAVKNGLIAEIDILRNLSHKYLPSIVDIIDDGDTCLIVMDYIQGKSLHTILNERMEQEGKPISLEDTISWGKQLCDVLYYLHTRPNPIIYRDMKPANIMLRPNGEIALIDFGTARVFKSGNAEDTTCLGTPGYAAPEQYGGNGQSGPQTDIYCLGATLHHLITGRNPAATPFNFPRITQCRPSLLEPSSREWRNTLLGLEMIIEKCTKYEMKDRYQSCAQLKYDLEHPEGLGMPYRKQLKKKVIAFGGCAAMTAILGGVSLFGKIMGSNTEKSGFDYYISKAETSSGTESLNQYRKAIALNPVSEKGYLGMLDTMLQDNEFSTEEDVMINIVLDSKDNGREKDNNTYFKTNKSGYIKFSYQLGLAYYYSSGSGGDKASAKGWFRNVMDADMDAVDLGEDNSQKDAWKIRAEILGKICEYSGKIGVANQAGDEEVSYKDYWYDLISMMDENVADRDNVITELRLYYEIVYQVFSRTIEFKDAGLEQTALVQVLDNIKERLSALDPGKNRQAEDLILSIGENIQMAKRNIASAYASGTVSKNWEGDS